MSSKQVERHLKKVVLPASAQGQHKDLHRFDSGGAEIISIIRYVQLFAMFISSQKELRQLHKGTYQTKRWFDRWRDMERHGETMS